MRPSDLLDAMPRAGLRRMVRGARTRDYENLIDIAQGCFGVAKSSVSRDFVRASAADVKAVAERRFEGVHFPAMMIDGVECAGRTMVVTPGMTEYGNNRILGQRQGGPRTPKSAPRFWKT
jgi:putative transposase